MKRFILISMMALVAVGAWGQDLATFQTGFTTFSADMASTLSYNATVGNNWSDAYLGSFPHFGVGLAGGVTAVPSASLEALFTSMGVTMPSSVKDFGLPVPAAALSAKIGGLFLPFDVGVKAMILPEAVASSLSASGITADYQLFGGNVRFGLVKEGLLFPDVSVGAGYNRLSGSISMPLDTATQTYTFNDGSTDQSLTVTDPDLSMEWTTDSFDFTLQVSKKFLFIRPYLGTGLSVGKSTVKGGMAASMVYDPDTATASDEYILTDANLAAIKQSLADAGLDVPDISADGFMFGSENSDPVIRLYGGFSLELLILSLDLQGTYVPSTKSLGASAMVRVEL
ncbi:MAG: hypothetical protein CVV47_06050 [Spirochaetae bacterium HGW-Spirochaetae-3]|jgi:hypothetical protein|nr:MAG: hypothetical protein CVV47_06050 [Spirochaetae bacterium HGW-Spirochaetae-3]